MRAIALAILLASTDIVRTLEKGQGHLQTTKGPDPVVAFVGLAFIICLIFGW